MFDAVRNNKRIVQVFLALITLPFAFWGVESYVRNVSNDGNVAKVGDFKITQQQFQQALHDQQERLQAQMGNVDPKLLDNPEARKAVLDDLIDQRLLALEASKSRLMASDAAVSRAIGNIPGFQVDGKFSMERYEMALRNQNMSPAGFEAKVRSDLTLQQLATSVGQTGIMSKTIVDRVFGLQTEKRDVQEVRLAMDDYIAKVKLDDAAVRKFYDDNSKQFEIAEQARAEYVVLSMDAITSQISVSDAEIKEWYEGHKSRFNQADERRASHILIGFEKLGKEKAKAKAQEVLAQVKKNPGAFGELAKKYSDDPGSAAKGGDLGFFGRGAMVKPFEDAAFGMKEGQISDVVESEFGYHIIKVTGVHGATEKPLSEVRGEIEAELKKTASARKFAEAAEIFTNMVYEQADSLKPVAEKFKLEVRQSGWLGRVPNPANGPLGNEKLLASLFSEDSIKNKRNTEAIETASKNLVAARILEYKPAAMQPFDAVKGSVETLLKRKEAVALAVKDGEAKLEALKKGDDKLAWGAAKTVSRLDFRLIPPQAAGPVFKLETQKLPAYTGAELPGLGYALFKVVKVSPGEALDDARRQAMLKEFYTMSMQEEIQAYLAALRARYKVEINQTALEVKDR